MAFSDLTLTRDDIDALEGETFRDLNVANTTLGLSTNDDLVLARAKTELEVDILEMMNKYVEDGTYASETALLDALYDVDDQGLLVHTLSYKFLELWFQQDATNIDGMAFNKAGRYYHKYTNYVKTNVKRLAGRMAVPKHVPRLRMRSSYGY